MTAPYHSFLKRLCACRGPETLDTLDRNSMACPALPLCGLAIGEAERSLPDVNRRIRAVMDRLGFAPDEHFVVRMTGCPNGCSRPYMAEIGLVGDGPNSYQLWLGGTPGQTRLAETYLERMKIQASAGRCAEPLSMSLNWHSLCTKMLVCLLSNAGHCAGWTCVFA